MNKDDAYWAEVREAIGKGTRSILQGTSTRALDNSFEKLRLASHDIPDICPQCGEADLVPEGTKHRCPVCGYLQPCCQP